MGLRKIHLQNLVVKSFSALLFHAQTAAKERQMGKLADAFTAKRYYHAWVQAFKWQVEVGQRVAFFQKRWRVRMQKKCLQEMQNVAHYLLRVNRTHAKVRRAVTRNSMATYMGLWKEAFVARHLEERLTTFQAFRALRQNYESKAPRRQRQRGRRAAYLRARVFAAWRRRVQALKQAQNHIEKRRRAQLRQCFQELRLQLLTNGTAQARSEREGLAKQLEERIEANKNTSTMYCQRIKSLEDTLFEKNLQIDKLAQVAEDLRQSIISKEQSQMKLSSELEKSTNELVCQNTAASLAQNLLLQKYQALEAEHKRAQQALTEFRARAAADEGAQQPATEQLAELTQKYEEEKRNNRALLKELGKAHQTVEQMKGYLEK